MITNDDTNLVDVESPKLTTTNFENLENNNPENSTLLTTILFQSSNIIAKEEHKNIELNIDTHDKLYNYLMNELENHKNKNNESILIIQNLNNTINILTDKIKELEDKLNKNKNIELLLKLKENLNNKQNNVNDTITIPSTEDNSITLIQPEKNLQNVNNNLNFKIKKKPLMFSKKF